MEQIDWRMWGLIGAGAAVVIGFVLAQRFRHAPDGDEIEHKRRSHLNQVGRIAEGQILEVLDLPEEEVEARGIALFRRGKQNVPANGLRKLVCYSYSISGVSYETAQDITRLQGRADPQRLIPGRPASVKYDPSNPGDSIVVTDDWSGLH
jgi:hypothetical protein